MEMQWQPIETAPLADASRPRELGPSILVWDGQRMAIAQQEIINKDTSVRWWRCDQWAGHGAEFADDGGPSPVIDEPTHWMPLPNPPE